MGGPSMRVTGILWRQRDYRICVFHTVTATEHLVGSRDMAAKIAVDAGLVLVHESDDTSAWKRDREVAPVALDPDAFWRA